MQQRLVAESKEERATRQENVQPDQHLPPFEQRCVQSAVRSFHQEMFTIDTPTCSTCMYSVTVAYYLTLCSNNIGTHNERIIKIRPVTLVLFISTMR